MPIWGWDFIETFRLSFDWNEKGQYEIIDQKAKVRKTLCISHVLDGVPLELAPMGMEGALPKTEHSKHSSNTS